MFPSGTSSKYHQFAERFSLFLCFMQAEIESPEAYQAGLYIGLVLHIKHIDYAV